MKKFMLFGVLVILLITVACGQQTATPEPTSQPTDTSMPSSTATVPPTTMVFPEPTTTFGLLSNYVTLPSGQYLAFLEACDKQVMSCYNLRAISMDGNTSQLLVENIPTDRFVYRGYQIAFTIVDDSGSALSPAYNRVEILDIKSGQVTEVPMPNMQNCFATDIAPDNSQLVILCDDLTIGLVSARSGELTNLLDVNKDKELNYNDDGRYGYSNPTWSPNGKWLLFLTTHFCLSCINNARPYLLNMSCISQPSSCEEENARRKTILDYTGGLLAWTPDNHLAWARNDKIEIYDVDTDGLIRTYQAVPNGGDIYSMAWSPDGQWIAVTQYDTLGTLVISALDGTTIHLVNKYDKLFWITAP